MYVRLSRKGKPQLYIWNPDTPISRNWVIERVEWRGTLCIHRRQTLRGNLQIRILWPKRSEKEGGQSKELEIPFQMYPDGWWLVTKIFSSWQFVYKYIHKCTLYMSLFHSHKNTQNYGSLQHTVFESYFSPFIDGVCCELCVGPSEILSRFVSLISKKLSIKVFIPRINYRYKLMIWGNRYKLRRKMGTIMKFFKY